MATNNLNFKVKNGLDAVGDISTSGFLKSLNSSGDEGGQIDLAKSETNTTLTTGVTVDVFQNRLRFFETGGTNRGYYIDISSGGTGAATNLVGGGGGGSGTVTSITAGTGLTGGTITTSGTIAIDTSVVPRLSVSNTFTADQIINGTITATPAAPSNTSSADGVGYVGMPQVLNPTSPYTISASDAGKHIYMTTTGRTITIPANSSVPLEIGTTITIINAASVTTTISITTDTMILSYIGSTGTRTLRPFGVATLIKIASTTWMISGNGVN